MQYAYKPCHSTNLCTAMLKEIIDIYVRKKSNVYCCLLDASKAFDRVHYGKLFNVLLSRDIHPCIVRIIVNSYIRQKARVSWGSYTTQYFDLCNGVKQGGVISAIFFTLYIDSLLIKLEESGYGCHMNGTFMGALSYSDDITIISPSIRSLNKMLSICAEFANNYCVTFNCAKSMSIKFGNKLSDCEKVKLQGNEIPWVDQIRHLGNFLNTPLNDKIDCRMKISSFYGYVNKLNANFGYLQATVLSTLFNSYCAFYGSQNWRLGSICLNNVLIAWNKGVRCMLNLPRRTHTWMLGPLLEKYYLRYQFESRTIRFLKDIANSSNYMVKTCLDHAMRDANSPIGYNLAFIRNTHGFNIIEHTLVDCLNLSRPRRLNPYQCTLIKELNNLLLTRNGVYRIHNFTKSDVENLIKVIETE